MTRSEITVDLRALRRNVGRLREAAAPAELWAVVKADAYGHGALDVAPAALEAGASALCVATAAEGEELRRAMPTARIIVLGPLLAGEEELARQARLEVSASTPELPPRLPVHVKVDTGMGRYGMGEGELATIDPAAIAGVMSHLATADDAGAGATRAQLDRFRAAADRFPEAIRHVANSAATLRLPAARFDAVRCGIALYGLSPFGGDPRADRLTPVLAWRSHIALVKSLQAGESTGYGRRFIADRETRIGIVPVGYGDGFRRGLTGAEVLVGGERRRILGTVSMDSFAVALPEGEVGDTVTLIGDGLDAEELARRLGTINYEVTTSIRSDPRRSVRNVVDG
jgi:alanine racemase